MRRSEEIGEAVKKLIPRWKDSLKKTKWVILQIHLLIWILMCLERMLVVYWVIHSLFHRLVHFSRIRIIRWERLRKCYYVIFINWIQLGIIERMARIFEWRRNWFESFLYYTFISSNSYIAVWNYIYYSIIKYLIRSLPTKRRFPLLLFSSHLQPLPILRYIYTHSITIDCSNIDWKSKNTFDRIHKLLYSSLPIVSL